MAIHLVNKFFFCFISAVKVAADLDGAGLDGASSCHEEQVAQADAQLAAAMGIELLQLGTTQTVLATQGTPYVVVEWPSLPTSPKSPTPINLDWLSEAQLSPLFPTTISAGERVNTNLPHATPCNGGIFFAHYHKTGHYWVEQALPIFQDMLGVGQRSLFNHTVTVYKEGAVTWDYVSNDEDTGSPGEVVAVSNPGEDWDFPTDACVVHWQRSPLNLVLSSYPYHAHGLSSEWWEHITGSCQRCSHEDLARVFGICNFSCSYVALLEAVDEETGLAIDAIMERNMMTKMLQNANRWTNNAQVLHLSMEHLRADYDATVQCMLRFLHLDANAELPHALESLDLSRSDAADEHSRHSTYDKYNSTSWRTFLKQHAVWGPDFRAAHMITENIHVRQTDQYGCPMPAPY